MDNQTKQYKALTQDEDSLITVLSTNYREARAEIEGQLTRNSSRRQAYDAWAAGGRKILDVETGKAERMSYLQLMVGFATIYSANDALNALVKWSGEPRKQFMVEQVGGTWTLALVEEKGMTLVNRYIIFLQGWSYGRNG